MDYAVERPRFAPDDYGDRATSRRIATAKRRIDSPRKGTFTGARIQS